jgi:hypothetical protein
MFRLPRHRYQLVGQPTDRRYLPIAHGAHNPFWSIRLLRGAVRAQLCLCGILLSRDCRAEPGGGARGLLRRFWRARE